MWPAQTCRFICPLIFIALLTNSAIGQILADPSVTSEDNFGYSIAINDFFIIVGDQRDDSTATNVGRAHLFRTATGVYLRTFDDPTPTNQDNFGTAVAADQCHTIIGAPLDNTQGPLIGQAVLYSVDSGVPIHIFNDPTPTSADFFGSAVDVDGDFAIVGAPGDDSDGFGIGQVHVYDVKSGQLTHTLQDPTTTGFDSFGSSVAISGDLVLVGDPGDDTNGFGVGAAHLFSVSTGKFIMTLDDPDSRGSDEFGASVAISGTLAIVGAPGDDNSGANVGEAYLFDTDSGKLLQTFRDPTPSVEDSFGTSVGINKNFALVGAPNSQNENGVFAGQAFLFDINSGKLRRTIGNLDGQADDMTGFAVSITEVTAAVGSPGRDVGGENVGEAIRVDISAFPIGDVNRDGNVDLLDVAPFVELLSNGGFQFEADIDSNGNVELLDIQPFVDLLTAG